MSGARPSETGSRASTEPASRLGPTGFDPARFYPCPFDARLARTPYLVLPKLALQVMPWEWKVRFDAMLKEMEDLGLATPAYEVVRAGGEIRRKMCRDKDDWRCGEVVATATIDDPWADYRHDQINKVARLCPESAIATEARRAETLQDGSVHEGAGPQDIAQNTLPKEQ